MSRAATLRRALLTDVAALRAATRPRRVLYVVHGGMGEGVDETQRFDAPNFSVIGGLPDIQSDPHPAADTRRLAASLTGDAAADMARAVLMFGDQDRAIATLVDAWKLRNQQ